MLGLEYLDAIYRNCCCLPTLISSNSNNNNFVVVIIDIIIIEIIAALIIIVVVVIIIIIISLCLNEVSLSEQSESSSLRFPVLYECCECWLLSIGPESKALTGFVLPALPLRWTLVVVACAGRFLLPKLKNL